MRNLFLFGCLLPLLCGVSGCSEDADSLLKQQIATMNEMADAIESGASEEEIKEIQNEMEEIDKKLEDLNLSDEEKKEVIKRHQEDLMKAMGRVMEAGMKKAGGDPGKMFEGGFPAPPAGEMPTPPAGEMPAPPAGEMPEPPEGELPGSPKDGDE